MPTTIVPYIADLFPAVKEFYGRKGTDCSKWGFYENSVPDWIPTKESAGSRREHYLELSIRLLQLINQIAAGRSGYLVLEDKRMFAMPPTLRAKLEPFNEVMTGLHLTNMDGHGPHGFQ